MEQLAHEHFPEIEAERRTLDRRAYGPNVPATADGPTKVALELAHRDAVLRASELESYEAAERMMGFAMRIGDRSLARATAMVSVDAGGLDVANRFAAEDEFFGETVNRLLNGALSRQERLEPRAYFSVDLPSELERRSPAEVDQMAATAPEAALTGCAVTTRRREWARADRTPASRCTHRGLAEG